MSYILDALKKADQEREQGQVPGLNTQAGQAHDAAPAPGRLSPMVWAGVGVALTLAGVLTWHNWPVAPAPTASTTATPAGVGVVPVSGGSPNGADVAQAAPALSAPAPTPRPPVMAGPDARPDGVAMQVDGAAGRAGTGWSAQPALSVPAPRPGERTERSERRSTAGQPSPDERATTILGPVPKLADLPEAVRRGMPALQVGGAMHSPNPAQRMLVLNGQVFHEGDSPMNGLRLEEIRLKSAILNYQGQRFELQY